MVALEGFQSLKIKEAGYGRMILNELEKIAICLNFKQVYVHSQSEALQFYKKAGYVETGVNS